MAASLRLLSLTLAFAPPAAAVNDFAPDPSFGTAGRTQIGALGPVPDGATSVILASGEYRLVGSTVSGSPSVSWAKLDANGQPVAAFGNQGFIITAAPGGPLVGASVVDSQGRTIAAINNPAGVARFLSSGNLDPMFAGDGTWNPSDASVVFDVALGPGDTIWVSKSLNEFANAQIVQLSATGDLTAYVSPDNATLGFLPFGYARLHGQPDGSFWWAGRASGSTFDQFIARFTTAGTLDPSYSGDGVTRASVACIQGQLGRRYQSFTLLPGGIAIVRGDHDAGSYMVAIYPDGTAGPARCEDGNGTIASTNEIVGRDATRFLAASFHCRADSACGALLRQYVVQPNGSIADDAPADLDAATQVFVTTDGATPDAIGYDVIVDQGRPVLVGSATRASGNTDFFAIRYFATIVFADGFEQN